MITDQQRAELKAKVATIGAAYAEYQKQLSRAKRHGFSAENISAVVRSAERCGDIQQEVFAWIDKEL